MHERRGTLDPARRAAEEALHLVEDARLALAGDLAKSAFVEDKRELFDTAVRLQLAAGDTDAALRAAQAAKSAVLADLLDAGGELENAAEDLPQQVAADWRAMLRTRKEHSARVSALAAAEEAGAGGTGSGGAGEGALVRAAARTRELAERFDALRARLTRSGHGELIDLQRATPLGAAEIAALLAPRELFLDLYAQGGELAAFLVDPEGRVRIERRAGWDEIRSWVMCDWKAEVAEMASLGPELRRSLAPSLESSARVCLDALGDALLGPFEEELTRADTLYVAPHGVLHALPFCALRAGGEPLLMRTETVVVPSASVLRSLALRPARPRPLGPALICAVDDERAPHFRREAGEVRRVLGERSMLLQGDAAGVEAVLAAAREACHLHFACHGEFDHDSPMASALTLAGDRLRAADFYRARIACPLVVLSGCETGRSRVRPGDELLGLLRGILFAGADAVVASLWRVDDQAAAELMGAFYRRLQAGASAAGALRGAQLELRTQRPHPFDWAPFALFGRGDVVPFVGQTRMERK